MPLDDAREWLEADGLGGFASGTVSGVRTRRYHALLLAATTPPTGRMVLVNGFDAWVDGAGSSEAISSHRYVPDVVHPDGATRISSFTHEPWPAWTFDLPQVGARISQEIFIQHGTGRVFVSWTVLEATTPLVLRVRPLMSGRDYHSLHHENEAFRFDGVPLADGLAYTPYQGLPSVRMRSNGNYHHAPLWFRQFAYTAERARGLDDTEDLASPGELAWVLARRGDAALWMLDATTDDAPRLLDLPSTFDTTRAAERRRRESFPTPLDRAADAYLVQRGNGRTIVAGYPWFTDWGRDTFIAIRGLCLATGRLAEARDILLEWADQVSEGMLPNRFPDGSGEPEFNSVDASLWYIVTVKELLDATRHRRSLATSEQKDHLRRAAAAIVDGYARGTRYGIRMDTDGLLAAGVPGVQLTWMDAKVGDWVVTPRIGKPVEVQALWINALDAVAEWDARWREPCSRARNTFAERFWSPSHTRLADVIDVEHVAGTRDDTFRPNQIFAIGGLPLQLLDGPHARAVVDAVETHLLTPGGVRSLAPGEPGYAPHYEGGPWQRDGAYHQGTVWPWLLGPFIEAWVRVRGNTPAAKREARTRWLKPWLESLSAAGLGHVSEITDAEPPFTPRGCPFQAWSLGELIRTDRVTLSEQPQRSRAASATARRSSARVSGQPT